MFHLFCSRSIGKFPVLTYLLLGRVRLRVGFPTRHPERTTEAKLWLRSGALVWDMMSLDVRKQISPIVAPLRPLKGLLDVTHVARTGVTLFGCFTDTLLSHVHCLHCSSSGRGLISEGKRMAAGGTGGQSIHNGWENVECQNVKHQKGKNTASCCIAARVTTYHPFD